MTGFARKLWHLLPQSFRTSLVRVYTRFFLRLKCLHIYSMTGQEMATLMKTRKPRAHSVFIAVAIAKFTGVKWAGRVIYDE